MLQTNFFYYNKQIISIRNIKIHWLYIFFNVNKTLRKERNIKGFTYYKLNILQFKNQKYPIKLIIIHKSILFNSLLFKLFKSFYFFL